MKQGTQERLNFVILLLKLTRIEIAEKTGYTKEQISRVTGNQEPTNKFILAFCKAFPKANKDYILNSEGEPLIGVDLAIYGFKNESADKQEIGFLRQQVNEMKAQITFLQSMLEKAMSIHPDLVGKLANPIAKHGKKDTTPSLNLFTQLGTMQGTFGN
jgi:transcriptional regulator with XRE-family HTH domain